MSFPLFNRRTRRLLLAVACGQLALSCHTPVLAASTVAPDTPSPGTPPALAPYTAPTQQPDVAPTEQMPFQKIPEIAPPVILAQNTLPRLDENNPTAPATSVGSIGSTGGNTGPNTATTNGNGGTNGVAPSLQSPAAPNNNQTPQSVPDGLSPGTPTPNQSGSTDDATSGNEIPGQNFHLDAPGGVIEDTEQELIFSQGPMTFTYGRDFVVHGDRGVYDERSHKAVLTGNLTVTVRGKQFKGKKIVFNTDTGRWVLSQIDRIFQPEEFPYGTVLDPLYVSGAAVSGAYDRTTGDISSVQGSNFKFTSCDRDHYYILSKRLDFYRDAKGEPDRIVLHRNALYLFRHKIIPLPAYVIPLNGQRSRRLALQPTVGQNDIDGFFVRTLYDLTANERRTDSLLIDALQKRGIGLGFQRELAAGAGLFYLYGLTGTGKTRGREIDSRIQRLWRISKSLTSNINFQSTQNNEFGLGSAKNGDIAFNFNTRRIQSGLFLRYNNTSSSFSTFRDFGATFQHQQDLGSGFHLDASSIYTDTQSSGVPASKTLDNIFDLVHQAHIFNATLRTELHDDLTGRSQVNGAYQLERVPELLLESDANRLHLPFLQRYVPGNLLLGIGAFNEPASQQKLTRANFLYDALPRPIRLFKSGSSESTINATGRFEQAFYSDDAARYNYNLGVQWDNGLFKRTAPFNADLNAGFGTPFYETPQQTTIPTAVPQPNYGLNTTSNHLLNFTVNYYKLKTVGFTPFQFDFLTPGETIAGTVSLQPSRMFRFGLSTGRDLQNSISNDIIGTIQFAPTRWFYYSLNVNYSPQSGKYGDLVNYLHIARRPTKILGGTLDLGLRYSPTTHQISQANATADLMVTHKTRVQALTSYNGFTKQFDFTQFRVVQDLHCFNLYATFDSERKELRLDLALKAFPFLDTRLGMNQQGAGFNPQLGVVR